MYKYKGNAVVFLYNWFLLVLGDSWSAARVGSFRATIGGRIGTCPDVESNRRLHILELAQVYATPRQCRAEVGGGDFLALLEKETWQIPRNLSKCCFSRCQK